MKLPPDKVDYMLDQCFNIIKKCHDYSVSNYSSFSIFTLDCVDYTLTITVTDSFLKELKVKFGYNDMEVKDFYKNPKRELFYNSFLSLIKEIEDNKFKKIFPNYSVVDQRDFKLDDLLGENSGDKEISEPDKGKKKNSWKDIFKF